MPPIDLSALPVERSKFAYTRRDAILYAIGIGCTELKYTYENDQEWALFPTYGIVAGHKGDSFDVINSPLKQSSPTRLPAIPGVTLDRTKSVDGERTFEVLKPLPKEGGVLEFEHKIVGVWDVGTAAVLDTQFTLIDPVSRTPYVRCLSSLFLRGSGGFGGQRPPKKDAVEVPKGKEPDRVVELKTGRDQATLYRLSGDYNPLHIDPVHASKSGFKEPILHGLCTFGFASRAILQSWANNDSARFVSMKGRFSSPVYCGETLVVEMWKVKEEEGLLYVAYTVKVKERSVVVMSGGLGVVRA
ncbi:hypothetical protein M427DRAFT_107296 [Gonapodya prolifera JEL478]|uniref:Uncharacterized protein n=1 Tax=Gonapodya prolifera (strain JEL478) TaxID=1344416 RepID=A0A139AYT6_GONPJ|nr:hypothetical protein M427DRAFT_107296 [Gonapodya prolifera JEL478]|eukprot:KXS21918.1 hypothetical protein M427DRAFT_107296 [Gonapodya prolifera JEL478]